MASRFFRLSNVLAISLFSTLTASCAGEPVRPTETSPAGEKLFNGLVHDDLICYQCHSGDGTGTKRGPNLGKRVPGLTDEQIARAIEEGPGPMPAFKGKISAEEIQEITLWLRARFPRAHAQ